MCGIAGIVGARSLAPGDADRARRMTAVLAHRGPDEEGFHLDDQAALGHRRLSIIDLAHRPAAAVQRGPVGVDHLQRRDLQPRATCGPSWRPRTPLPHAVGHRDDRPRLRRVGRRRASTTSAACSPSRSGTAAAAACCSPAIASASSRSTGRCAGDRLALRLRDQGDPRVRPRRGRAQRGRAPGTARHAVPLRRARRSSAASTSCCPGHLLCFEDGRVRDLAGTGTCRSSRRGRTEPATRRPRPPTTVARFRELLEESVRLRLMSDVPLGVFLSGGIDSSVIAALMARRLEPPARDLLGGLRRPRVQRAAVLAAGRRRHRREPARGRHRRRATSSARCPASSGTRTSRSRTPRRCPLYFVSRLAREHVTVVLTGEGSDELLAGYGKYPRALWNWRLGGAYARLVPDGAAAPIVAGASCRGLPARAAPLRAALVPRGAAHARGDVLRQLRRASRWPTSSGCCSPRLADDGDAANRPTAPRLRLFRRGAGRRPLLDRVLYTDIKTYLVELLMKQDQMSMATSIESRVPVPRPRAGRVRGARCPPSWKLSGLTTKRILREAARDLLPPEPSSSARRWGSRCRSAAGSRGGWAGSVRDVLLDRRTRERGLFDAGRGGRACSTTTWPGAQDATDIVWSLLNLELWYRTFIDGAASRRCRTAGRRRRRAVTKRTA